MPTIELSKKDLFTLIERRLTKEQLEDDLMLVKGELESEEGDMIKVEIADSNRPDLWSAEGITREIKTKYSTEKLNYKAKKSGVVVKVDKNLHGIRPITACAVIRGLKITPDVLSQLIQLQEKVCETFGSKRKEAAIGVYDLHKITSPIIYKAFNPEEIKFVPLEFSEKMNLSTILRRHPKGKEYGHLLEGHSKYPIFIDSAGEVLSMPPVINSNHTGKVTEETKDLFIECSGFLFKYVSPALNVIVAALVDRGGKLESVEVQLPKKTITTPDMEPKKIIVEWEYIEKRLGLELGKKKIIELLKKSRYDVAKDSENKLELQYPAYRQDIMHPADVAEDVIIRYGYNNIIPKSPELITEKSILPINTLAKNAANILVGLGGQEILSYTLTNKENHVKNMNLSEAKVIEIDNPVSKNWCVFRSRITPCLVEFLGKNTNQEYPQQIFEIGQIVIPDAKAETKTSNPSVLAWAKADKNADFTHAKQALDFLLRSLGLDYNIKEEEHDSFIKGRAGAVILEKSKKKIGQIGELSPKVLSNFGIEMPVCAFEINLAEMINEVKQ